MKRWNKLRKPIDEAKQKFYDNLPNELKGVISREEIDGTLDGFVFCNVPMSEIMKRLKIKKLDLEVYDDWYIYGVCDADDVTYSLLKMREYEKEQPRIGIAVSFVSLNMKDFTLASSAVGKKLDDVLNKVITGDGQEHNTKLTTYFSNASSQGSYYIADKYVDKIMKDCGYANSVPNNTISSLQKKLDASKQYYENYGSYLDPDQRVDARQEIKSLERIPNVLKRINKEAGYKIYDEKTGTITVKDPHNLSSYERRAILASHTGNQSYNSFAAEVKFHSDACDNWKKDIPIIGEKKWYSSAIVADAGLGEEATSGVFDRYYIDSDPSIKEQEAIHGKR